MKGIQELMGVGVFGSFLPDSNWEFVREVLNLTLQVLKPEGKFYAQVRTPHAEHCLC